MSRRLLLLPGLLLTLLLLGLLGLGFFFKLDIAAHERVIELHPQLLLTPILVGEGEFTPLDGTNLESNGLESPSLEGTDGNGGNGG